MQMEQALAVPRARLAWHRRLAKTGGLLLRSPTSLIGLIIIVFWVVVAVIGPVIAPYGINDIDRGQVWKAASSKHWIGTDNLGRDIFSRVILGAREILAQSGLGTLLAVLCGTFLGLLAGYRGGWFDDVLMRIFDSLLALPALLLALLFLGTLGPSTGSVLVVIMIVYTPIVARVVRSTVLAIRSKAYVEAARLQGERQIHILYREILPSTLPALTVEVALRFSYAIFLIASLGFLGVGVQPPSPNWGLMVKEARNFVNLIPWALIFPALAISIVVIGVNLLADGLKTYLLSQGEE